ncbi:hypothetical protein [Yinghuangia seranimata]|uniref:hypothetical protein n=1 Tax=Yinghuangia seranimata TaxID=408067 RepID=UPI00248C7D87|nr:hypothetical protein [Yinghuangia seranimata]MDI2124799.1 hypothetical protein [Yinghuangia seranimata]
MGNDVTAPDDPPARTVEPDRSAALEPLVQAEVGRVVYSHEALPAARPVNFVPVGNDAAFRVRGTSIRTEPVTGRRITRRRTI